MKSNDSSQRRRNLRLAEFDYSQPGAYFVTIVTQDRKRLFGDVLDGEMVLNDIGRMVTDFWLAIPNHFSNVELGEYMVMPNHIHGIISITNEKTMMTSNVGATHAVYSNIGNRLCNHMGNTSKLIIQSYSIDMLCD